MSDATEIGKRIKQARRSAGLTQTELGEAIGNSMRTIQRWEAGKKHPDRMPFGSMAELLGVSPEWLETGHEGASCRSLVGRWEALAAEIESVTPSSEAARTLRKCAGELREAIGLDEGPASDHVVYRDGRVAGFTETKRPESGQG